MPGRLFSRAVVTGIVAVAFAGLFGSQLFNTATPVLQLVFGMLVVALAAAGLSHLLINRVIWPYLLCKPARKRAVWIVISLLAGFLLIFTIPLTVYPKINTIRLTATGERNPEALGNEVWVTQIGEGNMTAHSLITDTCRGGSWIGKSGALVFAQAEPSTTTCTIRSDSFVALTLVRHPWSGIVLVEYGNQAQKIDLYSANKATGDEVGSVGPRELLWFPVILSKTEAFLYYLLLIADTLAVTVLLLGAAIYMIRRPVFRYSTSTTLIVPWFVYALPTLISWSVYLLIFWPGFVSSDTLTQLTQVATGVFDDWHPVFHTLTLWVLTRIWFSPAPIVILQIIVLSGLIGWALSFIEARGGWRWINWGIALFLAVSPALGLMILNPWKDIAYSISLVCLTLISLRVVYQPEKPIPWVGLGIIGAFVALYRHNGSPVAFGTLAALMVLARSRWKPLFAALVVSILLLLGVRGPLYRLVGVNANEGTSSTPPLISGNLAYLLSFHYNAGSTFSDEDLRVFQAVLPDGKNFDLAVIPSETKELINLDLRLSYANPRVTWQFFQSRFAYIFQVFQPPIERTGYVELRIYENPWGLALNSKLPAVQALANRVIQKSEQPAWDWLFWRNAFWMYVMILATVAACIRERSLKTVILLIPVLLNALPLALVSGGQISRYILPTLILAPLLIGFLFFSQPAQEAPVGVR